MTKNPRRVLLTAAALAALTLSGCSLATGATPGQLIPATPVTATPAASVAPATVTATPVTVTVTPPPAPAPAPHFTGAGSFQSPSGNINCALFSYEGQTRADCEVAEHSWVAPPKEPECHQNWGSRFTLNESGAIFACYGQELPTPERTLGYGSTWSVGTITCDSESTGVTCTDGNSGHNFFVSRDTWRLG
jgi:hypothetical protein